MAVATSNMQVTCSASSCCCVAISAYALTIKSLASPLLSVILASGLSSTCSAPGQVHETMCADTHACIRNMMSTEIRSLRHVCEVGGGGEAGAGHVTWHGFVAAATAVPEMHCQCLVCLLMHKAASYAHHVVL